MDTMNGPDGNSVGNYGEYISRQKLISAHLIPPDRVGAVSVIPRTLILAVIRVRRRTPIK